MSKRDLRVNISYILDCIDKINLQILKGKDYFMSNSDAQDVVVYRISMIGEAAKNIGLDTMKEVVPNIPWVDVYGKMNKLLHDYLGVDYELVWAVAVNKIPVMEAELRKQFDVDAGDEYSFT